MIIVVRGQRVILDADLVSVYGVSTRVLHQAVKRNAEIFPDDFAFQFTPAEAAAAQRPPRAAANGKMMRSQIVIASRRNIRFRPYAFTEHGTIMAANILKNDQCVFLNTEHLFLSLSRRFFL